MKMKKWSSQWTQFIQLRKEAWKKKKFMTTWSPEFFSGFFMQLHKLHSLLRSFLHFIFYFSQDTRIINLVFLLFLVIKIMASILLTVFPWCFWKLLHLPKVGWISSVSIKSKAGITVELATAFEVIALNFWCILNSQFLPAKRSYFAFVIMHVLRMQPCGFAMWRVYYPNEFASPTPPAPFPPPNQPPQAESCWLLHYFLFQESS